MSDKYTNDKDIRQTDNNFHGKSTLFFNFSLNENDTPTIDDFSKIFFDDGEKYLLSTDHKPFPNKGNLIWTKDKGLSFLCDGQEWKEGLSKIQYFQITPFISRATRRLTKEQKTGVYGLTIEHDNISLDEQWEIVKLLPYSALVFSGNKSIHCHFRFETPISEERFALLKKLIEQVFPNLDKSVISKNRLVRFPNGVNAKTGNKQNLLKLGKRINAQDLFELCYSRGATDNPEKENRTNHPFFFPGQIDNDFIKAVLDTIAETKGLLCNYKDFLNVLYACKSEGLDYDDIDYVFRNSDNYDYFGNLSLYENLEPEKITFGTAHHYAKQGNSELLARKLKGKVHFGKHKNSIEAIQALEKKYRSNVLDNGNDSLEGIFEVIGGKEKRDLFLEAGTGLGKTYTAINRSIELLEENSKVTFFCSTLNEANRVYAAILNKLDELGKDKLKDNVSLNTNQGEKSVKDIAITTYGYLGIDGMTLVTYSIANELIDDRIVFCDEPQVLFENMKVSIPLASRYVNFGQTIRRKAKCEEIPSKRKCEVCKLGLYLQTKDQFGKYLFYNSLPSDYKDYEEDTKKDWLDSLTNSQNGNLIEIPNGKKENQMEQDEKDNSYILDSCILRNEQLDVDLILKAIVDSYDKENTTKENMKNLMEKYHKDNESLTPFLTFKEYCDSLMNMIFFPQVRFYRPSKVDDNGKYLGKIPPGSCCNVPFLCGVSAVELFQLARAKQVVFMSATMPSTLKELYKRTGKETTEKRIDNTRTKYKATVFKTRHKLGKRVIGNLAFGNGEKSFVVCRTKKDLEDYKKELNSHKESRKGGLLTFYEKEYFGESDFSLFDEKLQENKVILTYARSAITRGANQKETCLCVIDCSQYIPQAAILMTDERNTKEDLLLENLRGIKDNVLQIMGRLLRSDKAGIDERNLVFVLHDLPIELDELLPPENLFESLHEFGDLEYWFDSTSNRKGKQILEQVKLAINGEIDKIKSYKKKTSGEIAEKPNDTLSPEQRRIKEAVKGASDLTTKKKSFEELQKEVQALTKDNLTWKEIYDKLNLKRKTKQERERLKEAYEIFLEFLFDDLLEEVKKISWEGLSWNDIYKLLKLSRFKKKILNTLRYEHEKIKAKSNEKDKLLRKVSELSHRGEKWEKIVEELELDSIKDALLNELKETFEYIDFLDREYDYVNFDDYLNE